MSMDQNDVWEVLVKSLTANLSAQEKHILDNWLEKSSLNRESYETFLNLRFIATPNEADKYKEQIFAEVIYRIGKKQQATRRLRVFSSIAATLVLLITTAVVFFKYGERTENAQLLEIFTPNGIKSRIVLSDSSVIILNSNSKLTYPSRFYGKSREISLEGEGYFNITKDQEHPFIVNTSHLKVTVLGTEFNIKSYTNDNSIETTLKEGSVNISGINGNFKQFQLTPGKQGVLDKRNNALRILEVDPDKISSWQKDKYYFDSKTFEEIAHVLERRFNVTIEILSEGLRKEIFSGDFSRGESLEQILDIIKKNTNITYTKKDQIVKITEE